MLQTSGLCPSPAKRIVYIGSKKTMDMPYAKLVNLTLYPDAVQFHL